MKNLTVANQVAESMTSIEISNLTGKRHKHVIRDIKVLLEQGLDKSNFGLTFYKDKSNRQKPCYQLTKKGSLILASGYDALLREKIIDRWEELEIKFKRPQTRLDWMEEAVHLEKENIAKQLLIDEQAPIIRQFNKFLSHEGLIDLKELSDKLKYKNKGRTTLCDFLRDKGVLCKDNRPSSTYNNKWFKRVSVPTETKNGIHYNDVTYAYPLALTKIQALVDKEELKEKNNKITELEFDFKK